MLEKFIEYMQNAGMNLDHKYLPANMDIVTCVFNDRCMLKDKKTFVISIALSGLEQLQGDIGYIKAKAEYTIASYQKAMKEFGGFERADVRTSP